jgi:DNA-binding protein HU-beta
MNKAELVNLIAEKTGETKLKSSKFVESFISVITETLKKGDTLTLIGFGSLSTVARKERKGRNPKTGAVLKIPSHTVVKFSAGKNLREAVFNTKTSKVKEPKSTLKNTKVKDKIKKK